MIYIYMCTYIYICYLNYICPLIAAAAQDYIFHTYKTKPGKHLEARPSPEVDRKSPGDFPKTDVHAAVSVNRGSSLKGAWGSFKWALELIRS